MESEVLKIKSDRKLPKHLSVVLSIVCLVLILVAISAFLFIPRKSNQALLPNTQKAFEIYPEIKIQDEHFTFPKEGLKSYLDLNIKTYGGNNAYEKKYMDLYKRGGLYITLSYTECVELQLSMSDDEQVTLDNWKGQDGYHDYKITLVDGSPGYSATKMVTRDVTENIEKK